LTTTTEASNACLDCDDEFTTAADVIDHARTAHTDTARTAALVAALDAAFVLPQPRPKLQTRPWPGPCPCECNSGGFCGGCGHAGCAGRR
jgi:hypothetical protein